MNAENPHDLAQLKKYINLLVEDRLFNHEGRKIASGAQYKVELTPSKLKGYDVLAVNIKIANATPVAAKLILDQVKQSAEKTFQDEAGVQVGSPEMIKDQDVHEIENELNITINGKPHELVAIAKMSDWDKFVESQNDRSL